MNHKLLISILLGATLLTTSSLVAMEPSDLLEQPICKLKKWEERASKLFHEGDNEEEEERLRALITLSIACDHSCSGCKPKHVGPPTMQDHIVHKELFMSTTFLEKYDPRTGAIRLYPPEDPMYPSLALLETRELERQRQKREKREKGKLKQEQKGRKQSRS